MQISHLAFSAPLALILASCGSSVSDPAVPTPPTPNPHAQATPAAEDKPAPAPEPPELRLGSTVTPLAYEVRLDLDPSKDTFTGTIRIKVTIHEATNHVWLHANELTVKKATLETAAGAVTLEKLHTSNDDFLGFSFGKTIAASKGWIELQYEGTVSPKDYHGLFRQEDDKNWYLYSQFEATSARAAFPCFDEPRFKVPWTLSLTVPRGMQAFSNTPIQGLAANPSGSRTFSFMPTKPLPSYLVALAVGPFDVLDVGPAGRNKTPVRMITLKGKKTESMYAAKASVELLKILEDYFDSPYPYAKLDHITVPHFLGAMENPGLITYDTGILLATGDSITRGWKERSANVIAHELAHQWFGDLVTLAWCDDTWLNESFASWMAAKAVDDWRPKWEGPISSVAGTHRVMSSDSLTTARRIRQPIETAHDIAAAFDGITYGKGSAVLSMFERAIGHDAFRKGVRNYLRKHRWQTATADDFLAALGEVSKPEMPGAFRSFLDQAGVPLVKVELSCAKGETPSAKLSQERYLPSGSTGSADQTWQIPVCLKYDTGGKTPESARVRPAAAEQCMLLSKKQAVVRLDKATRCPDWLMANAAAAGYYRVAYGEGLIDRLFKNGRKHLTPAERVAVIGDMNALVNSGKASIGEALAQIPTLLKDTNHHIVKSAVGVVSSVDDSMVQKKLRPNFARFIRTMFGKQARKLGWTPKKGETDEVRDLRRTLVGLVAIRGKDTRLRVQATRMAKTWLKNRKGIDKSVLGLVLSTAARRGDAALYTRIRKVLETTEDRSERRALLGAMASFQSAKIVKQNLALYLTDELDMREGATLLGGTLVSPDTRQITYDFVKKNFKAVSEKLPKFARGYIMFVAGAFCDAEHLADAKAFFTPRAKELMNGPKMLAQTLEGVKLCMAYREKQQASVNAFLRKF